MKILNNIFESNENETENIIFKQEVLETFSDEKKIIDIDEDKEIKKESNFILQNDNLNLNYNKIIDDNQINRKYFFNDILFVSNNFEEHYLKNFNNIIESNSNNQQLYILSDKKQNNHTVNKNKNEIFSINKEKKKNNYFTITKEKTEDKTESENNICIIINNSEIDEKIETNFINKKRNRNMFRDNLEIFSPREYDHYSKRMINEVLNNRSYDNKNLGNLFVTKLKTQKSNRKNYSDDIRKKIKSRFHKILKNALNEKLRFAGSIHYFEYLPQVFITNISKKENRQILNLTMEEILSKNFCLGKDKIKTTDIENYDNNLKVLKYLEENKEISKKSNFNNIKNMKYYEVFNEYLNSKEFEKEILKLKKKENDIYIRNYIRKAIHLIDFFNN